MVRSSIRGGSRTWSPPALPISRCPDGSGRSAEPLPSDVPGTGARIAPQVTDRIRVTNCRLYAPDRERRSPRSPGRGQGSPRVTLRPAPATSANRSASRTEAGRGRRRTARSCSFTAGTARSRSATPTSATRTLPAASRLGSGNGGALVLVEGPRQSECLGPSFFGLGRDSFQVSPGFASCPSGDYFGVDAAAAEAFWRQLEEQDAERGAAERRSELRDRVSSDLESLTTFGIASVSPCFQARLEPPAGPKGPEPAGGVVHHQDARPESATGLAALPL
jgi:hypothetical protein